MQGVAIIHCGIPPAARADAWEITSGVLTHARHSSFSCFALCVLCACLQARRLRSENPGYYDALMLQLRYHPTKSTRDIEKDVRRTMQNHPKFKTKQGLDSMTRALCAFSFRNPRIGYAQSMNVLLGTLLIFMPGPAPCRSVCFRVSRELMCLVVQRREHFGPWMP